jgi:hypothetical protein
MYVKKILSQEIIQRRSLRYDKTSLAEQKSSILGEKVFGVGDLEEGIVGVTGWPGQLSDLRWRAIGRLRQ